MKHCITFATLILIRTTLVLIPHISLQLGTVYYGPGGVIQRVEDDPDDSASDNDDPAYYG